VDLAWQYTRLGRAESDPRYYGYAQAALSPWWRQTKPPGEILLLRATLRQYRHDFAGALADLTQLLRQQPRNVQAWLTRSVILVVGGDYSAAWRSCQPLTRLASPLLATACLANVASLTGQAAPSYRKLHQALAHSPAAPGEQRLWALTVLADIAVRLGRVEDAQAHFRRALMLNGRNIYLLSAYADFLLDQDQPRQVRALLAGRTRSDTLLLRLALVEQRLDSAGFSSHKQALTVRSRAARSRGGVEHLGDASRLALHLLNRPAEALALALENWARQREPRDARLVLEAALAARNPRAARPTLAWLRQTGLEDARLSTLIRRIEEMEE
jgi:tetratricopeptide (TPR) repeat protein